MTVGDAGGAAHADGVLVSWLEGAEGGLASGHGRKSMPKTQHPLPKTQEAIVIKFNDYIMIGPPRLYSPAAAFLGAPLLGSHST